MFVPGRPSSRRTAHRRGEGPAAAARKHCTAGSSGRTSRACGGRGGPPSRAGLADPTAIAASCFPRPPCRQLQSWQGRGGALRQRGSHGAIDMSEFQERVTGSRLVALRPDSVLRRCGAISPRVRPTRTPVLPTDRECHPDGSTSSRSAGRAGRLTDGRPHGGTCKNTRDHDEQSARRIGSERLGFLRRAVTVVVPTPSLRDTDHASGCGVVPAGVPHRSTRSRVPAPSTRLSCGDHILLLEEPRGCRHRSDHVGVHHRGDRWLARRGSTLVRRQPLRRTSSGMLPTAVGDAARRAAAAGQRVTGGDHTEPAWSSGVSDGRPAATVSASAGQRRRRDR